jgi:unsaturated pyranuronate lyase
MTGPERPDDAGVGASAFADLTELDALQVWDGVYGRVLGGDRVTMAVIELEPSSVVPEHRHEHEQMGVCVTGWVTYTIGDETRELGPGACWHIPGGMPHEARAGAEGAVVVETWAPRRDDWAALVRLGRRPARWPL